MKRYLAYYDFWGFHFEKMTVQEIEVEKETPKMFYWKGQRHFKRAHDSRYDKFYSYHETYEEARDALIAYLDELIEQKQESIKRKRVEIEKLENASEKLSKNLPL
jgi:SpoVK/Ycf46/Vps4 family AAA+-type ATPase